MSPCFHDFKLFRGYALLEEAGITTERLITPEHCCEITFWTAAFRGGILILYTSTAPLPMRYTTMGYTRTSMRYTSTALYFYKQFTQAPNKIFLKHFKQKICK